MYLIKFFIILMMHFVTFMEHLFGILIIAAMKHIKTNGLKE